MMPLTFTPKLYDEANDGSSTDTTDTETGYRNSALDHYLDSDSAEETKEELEYLKERRRRLGLSSIQAPLLTSKPQTGEAGEVDKYEEFLKVQQEFFNPLLVSEINTTTTRDSCNSVSVKHAIAIHCTKCQQFGILAPAAVCSSLKTYYSHRVDDSYRKLFCQSVRTEALGSSIPLKNTDDNRTTKGLTDSGQRCEEGPQHIYTCGGVLVRTKCKNPDCNQAVECVMCRKMFYNNESTKQRKRLKVGHQHDKYSYSDINRVAEDEEKLGLCFGCYTVKERRIR
jgi:hypothetical protein